MLFEDAVDHAVAFYDGQDPAFRTRIQFWRQQLAGRDLASITPDDVEDGIDALVNKPRLRYMRGQGLIEDGRPITPSTANRYVAALGTLFRILGNRSRRILPRGFQVPTKRIQRLPESPGRVLQVTVADVRRLVVAARLSRNRTLSALIAVAATTGLRMGNLQRLVWADVDLDARHITCGVTKNGTPSRAVLPPWAADELRRIAPAKPDPAAYVFGRKNPIKAYRSALADAGLPTDWTLHHLRHVAASVLAESGAPLPVIMQALNHKTPAMALRYSHVNTAALGDAMAKAWK